MKKLMHIIFIAFSYILIFSSCSKDEATEILPTDKLYVIKDASYGTHPLQKMDIYLPPGRNTTSTKTVVFIHGGGWDGGDKEDLILSNETLERMMEEFPGYALLNLNYRLVKGTENQYPAAEEDIAMAMNYFYANLETYQVSATNYLIGFSAGAHLAALHTLKHNNQQHTKGCIAFSGAYDFTAALENESAEARFFVEQFMGGTYLQKPQAYRAASPIFHIQQNSSKFFIIHGENDPLISVNQAKSFAMALNQKSVLTKTLYHQDAHGISLESLITLLPQIKEFLK